MRAREFAVKTASESAGLPRRETPSCATTKPVAAAPKNAPWLSDERIAETRRVWSQAYGRVISVDEAVEILLNVRRFAEVLLRAVEEGTQT